MESKLSDITLSRKQSDCSPFFLKDLDLYSHIAATHGTSDATDAIAAALSALNECRTIKGAFGFTAKLFPKISEDGRCGVDHVGVDGRRGKNYGTACDAAGGEPCCSNSGWCGIGKAWCGDSGKGVQEDYSFGSGKFVVSFAGTKDIEDAIADVKSAGSARIDLGGKSYLAGAGFVDFYKQIRKGLQGSFDEALSTPGTEVLVTGHSLGGAIANLCAVDLANKYKARVRLVTFGAPRVFKEDSAKSVQQELVIAGVGKGAKDAMDYCREAPTTPGKICTQRWVNDGDGVPVALPCTFGYTHIGNGGFLINLFNCGLGGNCCATWCTKYFGCIKPCNALTATPQHQEYTPYNAGNMVTGHFLDRYYDRMEKVTLGQNPQGRTADGYP